MICQMNVRGHEYIAASLRDLSERFQGLRDASGEGASTFPEPVVFDANGQRLGYISYNGKVWADKPDQQGDLLFDPAAGPMADLTPGQPVNINFTGETPFTLLGEVVKNSDASCQPLVNMWLVKVTEGEGVGSSFVISGAALTPREVA